jgi:hypothetical protein
LDFDRSLIREGEVDKKKRDQWIWFACIAILELVTLAFFDWKHFFPLAAHRDLRFQAIGEIAAYTVSLFVLFALQFIFAPRYRSLSVWVRFPFSGFLGTLLPIAFEWRSFFDGPQFALDRLYLFLGFGIFSMLGISEFARDVNPPSKKTEKTLASS